MLESVTLDQLRTFLAVVDEGSFSAAGRRLKRVQSAVSHAIATLEAQLEVALFDRRQRRPVLTDEGRALLGPARAVLAELDTLGRVADSLASGLEPSLSLAVDALLPPVVLVDLARELATTHPTVQLSVITDTLGAVARLVEDGTCPLGVVSSAVETPGLVRQHLTRVQLIPVAAPTHPLAKARGPLSTERLGAHLQVVFSERGPEKRAPDRAVLSPSTWRIADLGVKHALLLGGLGWGNMPAHLIREDLAAGRLVRLRPAAWSEDEWHLSLAVVHRPGLPRGPATRWLLERLAALCAREARAPAVRSRKRS